MFPFKLACTAAMRMRIPGILFSRMRRAGLPVPLIVRCWSRVRTLERIHLQPPPANEFPAPDPMPSIYRDLFAQSEGVNRYRRAWK